MSSLYLFSSWPILAHIRNPFMRSRRIILSFSPSRSFSRCFQSSLSHVPSGLSCLEKSRPRVPRRDRSRGPAAREQMLRWFASLYYTVKTDGTRHLIPPRNVLSDFSWDSQRPGSRAQRKRYIRAWPSLKKDPAYSGALTLRDRRCSRGRNAPA